MIVPALVLHPDAPAARYRPRADHVITIQLLGLVSISRTGCPVELRRKGHALLAYLAVTGRPHQRTSLAALFCPEADDPAAALRLLLTRIRAQLGPDVIQATGHWVDLNRATVWADVAVFERLLAKNGSAQTSREHLAAAADLYHGQLCDGFSLANAPEFDLWLAGERAHLQQQYEQTLLTLLHAAEAGEQIDAALQYARQLVQTNPLLELAHERLIRLYLQSGQRDAALAHYEQCCTILQRELGIDPGPEIQQVFEALVHGQRLPHPAAGLALADDRGASGFVGRNSELHYLLQLWDKARSGAGATVLIEAPAGGGKSRLLAELCRLSQARSVGGACSELAQALPYAPWVELLDAHLSDLSDATIAGLAPVWRHYLLRLLPSLAARLGQRTPPAPPTAGGELDRLFTAVAELLFPATDRTPLLIWIEDLHWADESSLRLFHALARRAPRHPLLLIGVLRPSEAWNTPLLQTMIDELHAHGLVRITLPPLPADSIATLSAQLWPGLPSAERDQLQAQIMAATGGNPLLEVELLRELAAHAAPPHTLPLPSSVRDLVVRRMGRLAAAARPVIEALAVLDNPSAIVQLSQISACTIDETAHALDTGMRLGLLHERHTTGQTRYDIAHGLLRAAILDDLSAVRRQLLHRRTASVLAAAAERDQGHEQSGLFGRIMRHAEAGDAPELIIVWALPAAQHATSVYAFSEAKAFLDAGIAAYPRIAQPDHKRAMERHSIALLLHLAMLHETLASPVTVVADLLAQARALITRRHDDRLWALFYRCEALELNLRGRFSAIPPVIQRGYAAARRAGDLQLAATCLNALASAYITTSQNRVGAAAYQQALQLWQRLGDTAGERRALIGLSLTELNYGQVQTAIDRLEQVLAIERQRGDQHGQAYCCYALAYAWGFFFHGEHVSAYAEQAIALYTQLGLSQGQARATLFLGFAHEIAGDWAAAEGLYRACWQTAVASDDIWLIGWSSHLIGRMRLLRGDLEDAEQWLHDAYALRLRSDQVQNQVVDRGWLAQLALAQNDPEDALDHSLAAVRLLEESNSEFYAWDPGIYLSHVRALAAVGDRPAAAVFVERAEAALRSRSDQIRAPEVRRIFFNGFFARHIEQVQREIGNEWSCWPARRMVECKYVLIQAVCERPSIC